MSRTLKTAREDEGENPYLALRRAKIARNEAKLNELGLLRKPVAKIQLKRVSTPIRKPFVVKQVAPVVAVRRSTRTSAGRPVTYKDPPDEQTNSTIRSIAPASANSDEPISFGEVATVKQLAKRSTLPTASAVLPANSARAISLHVQNLVEACLGNSMPSTGKAIVMEESARLYAHNTTPTDTSTHISFNKYCGVQEWASGVFLWVNLGGKQDDYVNDFEDRQMTWFGGSRMHAESKPILKLLDMGMAARDGTLQDSDGIVLWCRRYEAERKTFGPYYCFGRLAYVSHNPNVMPISFVWTLLDYDRLVSAEDNTVILEMLRNE